MAVEDSNQSKAASQSSGRARPRKPLCRSGSGKGSTPSPTRPIEPGREHYALSAFLLRALKRRAEAQGIDLDIGQLPQTYAGVDATPDDPERPVRLIAHALARTADRVPVLRKLSRHAEGTEKRAGLGSDLVASAWELYARNQEQVDTILQQYVTAARQRRAQAMAAQRQPQQQQQ